MFKMVLNKVSPLGDFDEKYGQRYWGEAIGENLPISFNTMSREGFNVGDAIEAEEKTIKISGKGKEYFFLKKVKKTGSTPQPSSHTTASSSNFTTSNESQLDRIEAKLDKLLGLDSSDPEQAHAQAQAKRDAATFSSGEPLPEYFDDGEVL